MNIPLSPRLTAVMEQVEGRTLADIGTDHAYVPVACCLSGLIDTAAACDIKPGPLKNAAENIRAYQLEERIQLRLGGGLTPLMPGEFVCIVIAGMGGARIMDILTESPAVARSARRLVLQPQHDIPRLRKSLHENFYEITNEIITREEDRFYVILTARPSRDAVSWSELEYRLGKHLLARRDAVLYEYITREKRKLSEYIDAITTPEKQAEMRTLLTRYTEVLQTWR